MALCHACTRQPRTTAWSHSQLRWSSDGAPAVVRSGRAAGGVDVSACRFAVEESREDSGDEEMDVQEELWQLRSQIGKAVTFGTVCAKMQERHLARSAPAGYAAQVYAPTAEAFPGGVGLVPVGAVRPHQVVGCGAPPFGFRPHFIMLACFIIGLLTTFGIAGVTAGLGDVIDMDNGNSVTEDPGVCIGATCLYSGVDSLSPEIRQQVLQLFAAAGRW
ncbi:hypothetical protein CYMTET_6560 [Cymbomonas tetramitiformis]|uniref:Uncharacterized protein n=1 Tax=Cymbomonas tetramitiformis TaxID=36881 RepID=A0AAE0GWV5_9CHLO|nr:hypothetical protein CYMTET_6560 [Cymbomonas tetramitiformis]